MLTIGYNSQFIYPLAFWTLLASCMADRTVQFTVEDSAPTTRHIHHLRHTHGPKTKERPPQMDSSFSLNCPHVADAGNNNVSIEVTWTLNDTIWLKIENGEKKIFNYLTKFNKRTVGGKTVLRALLRQSRYFFDYDELTGDFTMEIRPVIVSEDVGVWQCHVTVHNKIKGLTHTLTSRSRVRIPHQHRLHEPVSKPQTTRTTITKLLLQNEPIPNLSRRKVDEPAEEPKANSRYSSFTRRDQETVQINRDDQRRQLLVVFNRQEPSSRSRTPIPSLYDAKRFDASRHALASIDYEMSMAQEPVLGGSRSARARHAYRSISYSSSYQLLVIFSLVTYIITYRFT